jgi:starch phosphorylase
MGKAGPQVGVTAEQAMVHAFAPRPLPANLQALSELALDLRWTWSHGSDRLWQVLDRASWEVTANPPVILESVSEERLADLARDHGFVDEVRRAVWDRAEYLADPGWYGRTYPNERITAAYFSMEFGLGEALGLYAGGLGVLAGDFLKASSDLAIPVIGVGLLYQQGYFRQVIDERGNQIEAFPYNDPITMPIFPLRDRSGAWMCVAVELPGRSVLLRLWQANVGRTRCFLLDTNHPLNSPGDRGIASQLYDAEPERRLLQEIVLGIGGWRALEAAGFDVNVLHLNEGHVAFAALERARSFAKKFQVSFDEACLATRAGNIFTTHTPIAAGFDSFDAGLVAKYLRDYASTLGISTAALLDLGRGRQNDRFGMAFLAGRLSGSLNAVSAPHEKVTRRMAAPAFARWPEHEIPVTHVTNGIHTPSWDSEDADHLWTRLCGKGRWRGDLAVCACIGSASDEEIWSMRALERKALVDYARAHLVRDLAHRGADPAAVERVRHVLDPNALTLGLARRFAAYKRPTMILHDLERFRRILLDPTRRVQLIVAGKAHPRDSEGKALIHAFTSLAQSDDLRDHLVFLEDYDISSAQRMVAGVDVWLNTPETQWEACGTSGMKVLVNGGLNLSTLAGWWEEGYQPQYGWELNGDPSELYDLLERKVIPEFYERDELGLPRRWIARVRASMTQLTPRFSANRMLREYVERLYLPAAHAYARRTDDGARIARELYSWRGVIRRDWPSLHFGRVHIDDKPDGYHFAVQVYLGDLKPELVRVELYAEPLDAQGADVVLMRKDGPIEGSINGYFYLAQVDKHRRADDYTARVVPYHPEARVPLEENEILWQK